MGINFGVSANSLANGSSIIAESGKLSTAQSLNKSYSQVLQPDYSHSFAANSNTAVFVGMGSNSLFQFTPKYSGEMFISLVAIGYAETEGAFVTFYAAYGDGTPPSAGTTLEEPPAISFSFAPSVNIVSPSSTALVVQNANFTAILTGLTIGTTYWIDVGMGIDNGTTSAITGLCYQVALFYYEL
jgi:hypothetical protein